MINRVSIGKDINLTCILNKKFKTSRISFTIFVPLEKKYVSTNSLVINLLEKTCKKYPNFSVLNKKLDELYGVSLGTSINKLGDLQALNMYVSFLNQDFIFEDNIDIVYEASNLLCDMIFDPVLDKANLFDIRNISQEKRQLTELILSEYSDKRIYARLKCEELMCKNERSGINKLGDISQIEKLDLEEITEDWKNLLETSHIEIVTIGSENLFSKVKSVFKNKFENIKRRDVLDFKTEIVRKVDKVREIKDFIDVKQSKLILGFRTDCAKPEDGVISMKIMTVLLGGYVGSKLFLNVREKMSLCYYCSALFNKHKGLLFVESGVEESNIEKAKEAILKEIEDIKLGNFTAENLESTKMYVSQAYKKIDDKLSLLDDWYVTQSFSREIKTPKEVIQEINSVKKEEIIESAKKLILDTVYVLTSKEKN
ncbi:MAG: predicted Zn-dependent peptidases [Candidatus Paraimprobicoccus trichonymphae]|uniref:Predicted Zn-dependent peptidases n=1 Tax=Candidatus Paraimprobicoccus trichonymphae TaxID=3033793 RepID=A0AA48I036_9FIRM|nr:MAG: predicted Zn-dependent peptidases [Candidatus Paraimprobicoccus trichonymphae]